MFLLSTDGYSNSFYNNEGFKKAGADFYKLWHDEGKDYVENNIGGWLSESSAQGSGDDITLALLVEEGWPVFTKPSKGPCYNRNKYDM